MKNNKKFVGVLLIGIGLYFILQQYNIPFLSQFGTWPTILIVIGIALLFNGYFNRSNDSLFPGVILLGLGFHFHALHHIDRWIDHWGMYTLIVGLAFLIKAQKGKQGILPGILLILISFVALTSIAMPGWFYWFDYLFSFIERFWPFILIITGSYLMIKK